MAAEVYTIDGVPMERRCIVCGAEIHESMGCCLAEDVLSVLEQRGRWIREMCAVCAAQSCKR